MLSWTQLVAKAPNKCMEGTTVFYLIISMLMILLWVWQDVLVKICNDKHMRVSTEILINVKVHTYVCGVTCVKLYHFMFAWQYYRTHVCSQ